METPIAPRRAPPARPALLQPRPTQRREGSVRPNAAPHPPPSCQRGPECSATSCCGAAACTEPCTWMCTPPARTRVHPVHAHTSHARAKCMQLCAFRAHAHTPCASGAYSCAHPMHTDPMNTFHAHTCTSHAHTDTHVHTPCMRAHPTHTHTHSSSHCTHITTTSHPPTGAHVPTSPHPTSPHWSNGCSLH